MPPWTRRASNSWNSSASTRAHVRARPSTGLVVRQCQARARNRYRNRKGTATSAAGLQQQLASIRSRQSIAQSRQNPPTWTRLEPFLPCSVRIEGRRLDRQLGGASLRTRGMEAESLSSACHHCYDTLNE